MQVQCENCNKCFDKPEKEVKRKLKNGSKFFCCLSCSISFNNRLRNKSQQVEKMCPVCGDSFIATTGSKETTFCSRSCASKGSVTDYRRQKARESGLNNANKLNSDNIHLIAKAMRRREAWKYELIESFLKSTGLAHEFEYVMPGTKFIYDLALFESRLLIEFDGPDHRKSGYQASIDEEKDRVAGEKGWLVKRVKVEPRSVIPVSGLLSVLMAVS